MRKIIIAGVASAIAFLSGCATLSNVDSQAAALANQGIELAASGFIALKAGSSATAQQALAVQIEGIATSLKGVVAGSLTIAQFNTQAAAWIANLSATDKILAQGLLTAIDNYFATEIAGGSTILSATTTVVATAVLNDIIAACVVNGAPPPASAVLHRAS